MTIAIEALSVRIGARVVLDGVAATLGPAGLVGIIGPNGAGKSTLARAMLGLQRASSGTVRIDGADVATLAPRAIARAIAYLPQGQAVHWPLSVARLIGLGRLPHLAPFSRIGDADAAAIERAMAATDVAGLRDRIVTTLSGGERARVLLARALAMEAPALLVDEPLAALDPGHQIEVMDLLAAQAARGVLVVAVLHDLGMAARYCDRLLLLDGGRLVADGAAERVLSATLLRAVYGIEAWWGESDGVPLIVPLRRR